MEMRTCTKCNTSKPFLSFAPTRKGSRYRRQVCNACRKRKDYASHRVERQQRNRGWRRENPVSAIYADSRKSDRRIGRVNDLTREFIQERLQKGCSYCGTSDLRMTLDRIDNTKGHTQDNVVPACIRCNYTRKDMPYEAWLIVAKGMREAREAGLFGDWTGSCHPTL